MQKLNKYHGAETLLLCTLIHPSTPQGISFLIGLLILHNIKVHWHFHNAQQNACMKTAWQHCWLVVWCRLTFKMTATDLSVEKEELIILVLISKPLGLVKLLYFYINWILNGTYAIHLISQVKNTTMFWFLPLHNKSKFVKNMCLKYNHFSAWKGSLKL